ncbi:MAG: response regulator [Lachnospiraceae bacterium]|nr:response regulator [Lachnospiraceae bacterium]
MLKIFLAEDEFVVREGIKNNIDWTGHGYEFVGEASDGELALPMIQRLQPDIVITDIKMPFMDGLELSRLIRKEYPWIEIIILSGYAEFSYAKEAITIGVAHYLNKPINGNELLAQVDKLAEKIKEKRRERELREKYMVEMAENSVEDKRKLFKHMVTGDLNLTELLELAHSLDMDLSAGQYSVMLFQVISSHHSQTEYSGSVVSLYEEIEDLAAGQGALIFDRNTEGKAIVFRADSVEELENKQKEIISYIDGLPSRYSHISCHGGIGEPTERLSGLPESFRQASQAYAHRFFSDRNGIRRYVNTEHPITEEETSFSISSIDPKEVSRTRIIEFLRRGQKDETEYFVDEFLGNLGDGAMNSGMFRNYLATEVYFAVIAFVEEIGADKGCIDTFDVAAGDIRDKETSKEYFTLIIHKAVDLRDTGASNRYGSVIDEVKKYIEENYGDEELSLNKIAGHVNFSPNHLSTVFSAQTGMTFIKYLTDYRMNKAKELLRCTSKRGSDISYEVGYKDPHYFSYLFKRTQGMTPTQYRELS